MIIYFIFLFHSLIRIRVFFFTHRQFLSFWSISRTLSNFIRWKRFFTIVCIISNFNYFYKRFFSKLQYKFLKIIFQANSFLRRQKYIQLNFFFKFAHFIFLFNIIIFLLFFSYLKTIFFKNFKSGWDLALIIA